MRASYPIPVIDLFAGPGGLGEGFSAVEQRGKSVFRVVLSIEKDPDAWATLVLRKFFRQFRRGRAPAEYYQHLRGRLTREELYGRYPDRAAAAHNAAWLAELGGPSAPRDLLRQRIAGALGLGDNRQKPSSKPWVLIGGPPCQPYSLAGRVRNRAIPGYVPEKDERHLLYREYLRILADWLPPVFVMENVPGLLSAQVGGQRIFERILEDITNPGGESRPDPYRSYKVVGIEKCREQSLYDTVSRSFVVRAEEHGIPQRRHRVVLIGIRADLDYGDPPILQTEPPVPAERVLRGLPPLRSGVSDHEDTDDQWLVTLRREAAKLDGRDPVTTRMRGVLAGVRVPECRRGGEFVPCEPSVDYLPQWFLDRRLGGVCNHSARAHMSADLGRYLYAACFAQVHGRSPRLRDFPPCLLPQHRNVDEALTHGHFEDRFRVQLESVPAMTVMSHISKDGHYYIHPDPAQCRSLTVREAARLQTFPDNYFFTGPRTSQYIQVGNAVPPLLAKQIGEIVHEILRRTGMAG